MNPTFSLLRAIRMIDEDPMSPNWRGSTERAVSDAAARRYGIEPQLGRVYIDLHAKRDMTVANASGLVATTSHNMFLPSLQGASIAFQLGAQRLDMGKDNGALPAIDTAPTTAWLADENTAISTNQPVIGSRASTPKALAGLVSFSHQLTRQSNPAVERILEAELARAIAAEVDNAVFNGSGSSGEPTGILGTANVQSVSGANLAWSAVTDAIEKVTTAGAPMLSPGFATTGAVREIVMGKQVTADTGVLLMPDANKLAGYPLAASKTGPVGALIFADWTNVYVPTWGLLEIMVDPFTGFKTGLISMRAILNVDVLVAHPASIVALTSVS